MSYCITTNCYKILSQETSCSYCMLVVNVNNTLAHQSPLVLESFLIDIQNGASSGKIISILLSKCINNGSQ